MFQNRVQAGKLLADKIIEEIKILDNKILSEKLVVLSIPRGGVVVGSEIAKKINCSHDIIVTKKLRAPHQSELAIGAVGETKESLYTDKQLIRELKISKNYLAREIEDRQQEIKRREQLYRRGRKAIELKNKTVIVVDDGAATGATIIAACREVYNHNPKKVIIALPVCARDTLAKLEKEADAVVALEAPKMFYAVGQFYEEFEQVDDESVIKLLASSH